MIEPYLIKNFITDTYSAIPARGIHKALKKLQYVMKYHPIECKYCLKIDAKHYYQSINHEILKQKYRKIFKDNELLWLLDEIIDSITTAEINDLRNIYLLEEDIDFETGIPIGNYLSQYSGNYYFSSFDHWMKEEKHIKYYFRYMDDVVIFGETKEELHKLKANIDKYFEENLKIKVKNSWQVFPSDVRGIDFLGFRVFKNYTLLRKSTVQTMKKKLIKIQNKVNEGNLLNYSEWCCVNSYKGWLKPCNSFRLQQKYIIPLQSAVDEYYQKEVKKDV